MADFCNIVSCLDSLLVEAFPTLVVICDIAEMIFASVVSFADAHRVVREVHIAVVTCWMGC